MQFLFERLNSPLNFRGIQLTVDADQMSAPRPGTESAPVPQETFNDEMRAEKVKGQMAEEVRQMQHQEMYYAYPLMSVPHTPQAKWRPILNRILEDTPNQAIAPPPVKRGIAKDHPILAAAVKRAEYRLKTPLFLTAFNIHSNKIVNALIIFLLCLNVACSIYLAQEDEENHPNAFQVLRCAELCMTCIFAVDISLWVYAACSVYGPAAFFADKWLSFDLFCFILSLCPPGMAFLICWTWNCDMMEVQESLKCLHVLNALRVFRIVPRIKALRRITSVLIVAARSILFLLLLISLIMVIFAVVGMSIFYDYTVANNNQFEYQYKFATFGHAFATVFQISTFDSWTGIYNEVSQVCPAWVCAAYFVGWVWLGAFVFSNIFVGIMVDEFKNRSELEAQKEPKRAERRKIIMMESQNARKRPHSLFSRFSPQLQLHGKELAAKLHKKLDDIQPHEMALVMDDKVDELDPTYKKRMIKRSRDCRQEIITPITHLGDPCRADWTNRDVYMFFESLAELSTQLRELKKRQPVSACFDSR